MASNPAATIAFRHMVEDGLTVLSEKQIEPSRRQFVLKGLRELMQEATRGSELVNKQNLLVSSVDRNAYESYSFIERHLRNHFNEETIKVALGALEVLSANSVVSDEARTATVGLLEELLASVSRDGNISIQVEPEEIRFAG